MLITLKIKNIALIKELEINFNKGLNILLGETGAGKSIIIDSLTFLFGQRADKSLIRNTENQAKVEGLFDIENNEQIKEVLKNFDIDFDDTLLISRSMSREGKNDIRVNGSIVTLNILKEITACLVDVYGQNEHQSLLKNSYQLRLLDKITKNAKDIEVYQKLTQKLKLLNEQLNSFGQSEENRLRQIDLLNFQIEEIENANLKEGEEEDLKHQLKKINNIEKISQVLNGTMELFNSNYGILTNVKNANVFLNQAQILDNELVNISERLDSCKYELEDIESEISSYIDNLEYDAEEFNRIDSRLDLISKLKRKYGSNIQEINEYCEKCNKDLKDLINSKEIIEKLQKEKRLLLDEIYQIGTKISENRKKSASNFQTQVIENLADLNMKNTQFKIKFNELPERENLENSLYSNGLDSIEFLFSANLGQPLMSLSKIISGGEMSRFMLAVKSQLANIDDMPTMIFDEIDTGISGNTATEVAKKMAFISKEHQVIVISHSFQIVAMADLAIYVNKIQQENDTISQIKILSESEFEKSISEMIGVIQSPNFALSQAKEIIKWSTTFKNSLK